MTPSGRRKRPLRSWDGPPQDSQRENTKNTARLVAVLVFFHLGFRVWNWMPSSSRMWWGIAVGTVSVGCLLSNEKYYQRHPDRFVDREFSRHLTDVAAALMRALWIVPIAGLLGLGFGGVSAHAQIRHEDVLTCVRHLSVCINEADGQPKLTPVLPETPAILSPDEETIG
jgi:hypothetical protein